MKRKVFSLLAMVVVLSLLAACAPKVVKETVIVEKPVEKVVKETVVVKEVVKETVVVEKAVEKQVAVTATPAPVEQVLIGAFHTGPGGEGGIPYDFGGGKTWWIKMFAPLTVLSADSTGVEPMLAESWESNDDYTVWTYHLRKDAKWSDGESVTAKDVKFAAELVCHPDFTGRIDQRNEAYQSLAGFDEYLAGEADSLGGLTVVDEYTVQFELAAPDPRHFTHVFVAPALPEHAIDFAPSEYQTTDWWYNPDKMVGDGPFVTSKYVKDEYWELAPNPNYFNGKPRLAKLISRVFTDETAAVLALAAGEIDFAYVSPDVVPSLDKNRFGIFGGSSFVPVHFHINYNSIPEAWRELKVRQAVLYAIDRKAICEKVLQGTYQVLPCIVCQPDIWPDGLNDYAYDPEKAKALLAEAGVDPADLGTMHITTHTGYDNQPNRDAVQAMQAYLADIGIESEMRFLDLPTWRATYRTPDMEFAYRGTAGTVYGYAFGQWLTTDKIGTGVTGYDYAADGYDELIAKITSAPSDEEYRRLLGELCLLQNQTLPDIYLWVGLRFGAANKRVKNFYWYPAPGGGPYDDHAETWYIKD